MMLTYHPTTTKEIVRTTLRMFKLLHWTSRFTIRRVPICNERVSDCTNHDTTQHAVIIQTSDINFSNVKLVKALTSRKRPKSAPYLRLKNSKRTSKSQSICELGTLLFKKMKKKSHN